MAGELRAARLTRSQLGNGQCELVDWRNDRGQPCASSENKALAGLALPSPRRPRSCRSSGRCGWGISVVAREFP